MWIVDNRHLVMAGAWVGLTIPAAIWWPESVLWVIVVSHYANFVGRDLRIPRPTS